MSCNTQLIIAVIIHQIFEFVDDRKTAQIVTFDFSKAVDKVSHRALIDKLHKFNISEQIINWIENFLKDRKQQVTINNISSKPRDVIFGVPQRSVLGPLLFCFIYVNDIVTDIGSEIRLFANDVIMYSPIKSATGVIPIPK